MRIALIIASFILAVACSPQMQVYSDQDPSYDITNFKTFDWGRKTNIEDDKSPLLYNELNDKRIKAAVMEALSAEGWARSEVKPDLIIHYHIIINDRSTLATDPYGYVYGPYWMRLGTTLYLYQEGTLIIDMMDPNENALVWRGWATAALENIEPEDTEKMIRRAVEKMFKQFPSPKKAGNNSLSSKK